MPMANNGILMLEPFLAYCLLRYFLELEITKEQPHNLVDP